MPSGVKDIQLLELKDTISQLNKTISTQNELISSLQKMLEERNAKDSEKDLLIANLQSQLAYLKNKVFGSTSEIRHDQLDGQLNLFGTPVGDEKPAEVIEPEVISVKGYTKERKPKATYDDKYNSVRSICKHFFTDIVGLSIKFFCVSLRHMSIAMGILITFGSYMKKEVSIEESTKNVEIFDTAIAMMAGLMIIPAVFAFSGGNPETLQAGPSLMFITIPKVFDSMGLGTGVGILFFVLVLFAAITSSIALTESAVSTFEDELGWERRKATVIVGIVMLLLGSLSTLGYGPLANVKIIGMQILDFFDFLTNSVMMPIAAIATCLLVSRVVGVQRIEEEVTRGGSPFRRKKIFTVMMKYLCPIFAAIILISSIANAFGWIQM